MDIMRIETDRKPEAEKSRSLACCSCGMEIFPEEIYYTLCVHREQRDSNNGRISIIGMRPLAFYCRFCEEKRAVVC